MFHVMFTRIIVGLLIAIGSFFLVYKTEWLHQQVGNWRWAEKYLGMEGGTRLAIKLIGILGVLVGIMVITNWHEQLIKSLFARLFGLR